MVRRWRAASSRPWTPSSRWSVSSGAPWLADLERHLRAQYARLSLKGDLAKAINYVPSRWLSFARFVDDGRIFMTNNTAERRVRTVAIGGRNWTFCGSDRGRERAAAVYTLIQTCRLNDVDPHVWLVYVIATISDHSQTRLHELLPWNWKVRQANHQPDAQAACLAINKAQANLKGLHRTHTFLTEVVVLKWRSCVVGSVLMLALQLHVGIYCTTHILVFCHLPLIDEQGAVAELIDDVSAVGG